MKDTSLFISQFLYRIRYWLLWGTFFVTAPVLRARSMDNVLISIFPCMISFSNILVWALYKAAVSAFALIVDICSVTALYASNTLYLLSSITSS